ncbi:hypothetical protein [Brevibacillus borstelensis]|nr:hypothetical protein [Brevibacillus borstelensis]
MDKYSLYNVTGRTLLDYEGDFAIDEDPADYLPPDLAIKAVRIA